ncbi:glycosyltransferase family 2 protein [Gryllotalpicola sp.]|uniref:glycosyltransferase family 2 protein n=1 Tax=Gryllotalpicola sp. TaxID=1932787 RepID=UPI002631CD93|nr:glycosyltransferase family 2 protein [Gryllotalpicola sp.]
MARKKVQAIIPAYNESENVDELGRQLTAVFDSEPDYDFEALIIENGSFDDTWEKLLALHERDPRFKIVQLARNFRMDGGLTAGLSVADGDAVILMTADLQDPPALIPTFLRYWEQGYENVYGVVTKRNGTNPVRRMNSQLFYWLAGRLTDDRITRNASDFRLLDRATYEAVRGMEERNRFVRGLVSWVGFKSIGVPMERPPRFAGESKAYTLKVIDLAFKGIFAHSYVPLRLITMLGFVLSGLALIAFVVFLIRLFAFGVPFDGYGTLVSLLFLGFGGVLLVLGVLGEYIGLIYEEVKQRPNFIISNKVGL